MIFKGTAWAIDEVWKRWSRAIAVLFLVSLLTGCRAAAVSGVEPSRINSQTTHDSSHLTPPPPSYLSPHVNVISSQSDSQLMIALDRPVIDIPDIADPSVAPPKTAVPVPDVVPVMPPSGGQPVMP